MFPHIPSYYVAGVYINQTNVWLGEFFATGQDLIEYSLMEVSTVEEYDIVVQMVIAQQVYQEWWERTKNNFKK